MLAVSLGKPSSSAASTFMAAPVPDSTYLASAHMQPVGHPRCASHHLIGLA